MSQTENVKPLKTWSHLSNKRRKPSEYEIVTANLHFNNREADAPYQVDSNMFMNEWYKKNTPTSSPFVNQNDGLMIDLSRKTEPKLESIKEIADYLEAL